MLLGEAQLNSGIDFADSISNERSRRLARTVVCIAVCIAVWLCVLFRCVWVRVMTVGIGNVLLLVVVGHMLQWVWVWLVMRMRRVWPVESTWVWRVVRVWQMVRVWLMVRMWH